MPVRSCRRRAGSSRPTSHGENICRGGILLCGVNSVLLVYIIMYFLLLYAWGPTTPAGHSLDLSVGAGSKPARGVAVTLCLPFKERADTVRPYRAMTFFYRVLHTCAGGLEPAPTRPYL